MRARKQSCGVPQGRKTEISGDFSCTLVRQGAFFVSEVFQNFVDAFLHRRLVLSAVFRSVAGFERAKCIFWYRFPTEANPWADSNRHTLSKAFQKSLPFKIYLQRHRCKVILDRFGLTNLQIWYWYIQLSGVDWYKTDTTVSHIVHLQSVWFVI